MKIPKLQRCSLFGILIVSMISMSSCYTSRQMNKYVANHYGNEIPAARKKKKPEIVITSALPITTDNISTSKHTVRILPLIVYWVINDKLVCTLNPQIPFNNFSNTVYSGVEKQLTQKLNGRKIELSLEQAPQTFSVDDKTQDILLVLHWDKVFIEPEVKDMIVSYKVYDGNSVEKTGKITVKDDQNNNTFRFLQSIKSGTSAYLDNYTDHISVMTKKVVEQLINEL